MEIFFTVVIIALGLGNIWQARRNILLRDRIDALVGELAELDAIPR